MHLVTLIATVSCTLSRPLIVELFDVSGLEVTLLRRVQLAPPHLRKPSCCQAALPKPVLGH